jgi:zinc transport system permease protein
MSFLDALTSEFPFIRNALIAGLIASASFGVIGTYVVARRISYIAAAIAHSVLGGIGFAIFASRTFDLPWLTPTVGALAAALLSALVIGLVTLYSSEREDTIIGAVWATGMAVGILFLYYSPAPRVEAMTYLFGDVLIISNAELLGVTALAVAVLAIGLFFYNKFVAICFDDEFVSLRGVNVGAYYLLLLGLTAVSIVLLVKLVGIVMAIAMLTIPPAIASRFATRLWQMMLLAILISCLFISTGLVASYQLNTPGGPTIILIAASLYTLTLLVEKVRS